MSSLWSGLAKLQTMRMGVLALTLMVVACGGTKTEQEYINSAADYLLKGEATAAIIEYKNALKLNPQNGQIRVLLGQVYLEQGDLKSAQKELQRALELGVDRSQVILPLAKALLMSEKLEQLLAETEALQDLPVAERLLLHIMRGQALMNQDMREDARLEFEQANELDPQAPLAQLGAVYLKTLDNQREQAIERLDALLEANPEFVEALLLKGRILLADGQPEAAVEAFQQLVKVEPNVMGYRLLQSEALIANKQFDLAELQLTKIREALPNHPVPLYYQAVVAFEKRDCNAALALTGEVLQQLPEHFNSRMLSAYCHFIQGNNEQAYQQLITIAPRTPTTHLARKILAITQFRLGYHDQAAETLRSLDAEGDQGIALLAQMGDQFMKSGEHAQAKELFERVLDSHSDPANMLRLGVAKLSMDDAEGLADIEQVLVENPEMKSAKLLLALNLIKRDRLAEALEIAEKWSRESPDSIDAANLLATVYRSMGRYQQAKAELERALLLDGDKRNSYYQLALVAVAEKQVESARVLYQRLLKDAPLNVRLLREWFDIEMEVGDSSLVADYLDKTIVAHPELEQGALVKAQFMISQEKIMAALSLLDSYAENSRYFADAAMTKGRALARLGRWQEARQVYQHWFETKPDDYRAALLLAESYELRHEYDKAINITRGALTKLPEQPLLGLMMANLQLKSGKSAVAAEEIAKLTAQEVDTPYLTELKGRLAMHQGEWATAIQLLSELQKTHPTSQRAIYLGHALLRSGDTEQAVAHLQNWLALHKTDQGVRSLLAQSYLTLAPKKSVEQYRILVEQNPKSVIALNNLAWLLSEQREQVEAERYARQALALAEGNPMVLDTLATILLAKGENAEALALLKQASAAAAQDLGIQFNYAKALAAANQNEQAAKVLDALLSTSESQHFPQRQAALALRDSVRGKG